MRTWTMSQQDINVLKLFLILLHFEIDDLIKLEWSRTDPFNFFPKQFISISTSFTKKKQHTKPVANFARYNPLTCILFKRLDDLDDRLFSCNTGEFCGRIAEETSSGFTSYIWFKTVTARCDGPIKIMIYTVCFDGYWVIFFINVVAESVW